MQKFETKNRNKIGLISLSTLLFVQLIIPVLLILSNRANFDDFFEGIHMINTAIIFIGFLIMLIQYKTWKPKFMYINPEGMKFIYKQKETLILFSEILMIKINSSKIITSKSTFSFPILHLNNLSDFLIELKSKLNNDLSVKELKHIDNRIALDRYDRLWKKAITPQILFFPIFLFVSFNIVKSHLDYIYNFSFVTEFMLMFSGILAVMFAEILRYVNFKKNFDITKINEADQKAKTIWMLYGLSYLLWFVLIFITVLFYK